MHTITLGQSNTHTANIIAGKMRIAGKTDDQLRAFYAGAREAGIDILDHPDL